MAVLSQQFSGSVQVEERHAVVALAGEIDIATIGEVRALLDQAIALGAPRVTLDLAAVGFLDAGGIGVFVSAAERLRAIGGEFSVRAASAPAFRLFEATGLTQRLNVERPLTSALARGLAGAAELPLTRNVLDAALRLVVTMAQAVVVGADGVSITLPRHGRLGTVAASNDVVLQMDHDQYDTGEGPCLDAATQGERFHIESLDAEQRWPAFVPRARARGIESILSTPLVTDDRPIGALNVYSRTVGAFALHEKEWADQFAAEASAVVSSAQVGVPADTLSEQIQQALLTREVIAFAQGVVMGRDGVSPTAAHDILREVSRRTGRRMSEVCDELVRSTHGLPTQ